MSSKSWWCGAEDVYCFIVHVRYPSSKNTNDTHRYTQHRHHLRRCFTMMLQVTSIQRRWYRVRIFRKTRWQPTTPHWSIFFISTADHLQAAIPVFPTYLHTKHRLQDPLDVRRQWKKERSIAAGRQTDAANVLQICEHFVLMMAVSTGTRAWCRRLSVEIRRIQEHFGRVSHYICIAWGPLHRLEVVWQLVHDDFTGFTRFFFQEFNPRFVKVPITCVTGRTKSVSEIGK